MIGPFDGATATDAEATADQVAHVLAVVVGAARGSAQPLVLGSTAATVGWRIARRPGSIHRFLALAGQFGQVGLGPLTGASLHPGWRFADPAWRQNAILRRLTQGYLAAGQTLHDCLVGDPVTDLVAETDGSTVGPEPQGPLLAHPARTAVTKLLELPDRGHSLVLDPGWRDVVEACLAWPRTQRK